MTTESRFLLSPIDAATAERLRRAGGPIYIADEQPGYPCRQCLLDADVGDQLVLVSHDPFSGDSPYRSASPIFLHLEACAPPAPTSELPTQLTSRQLSVRAFDHDEMMIDAAVVDGAELDTTIRKLFANEEADKIHVHNATRGCWAVSVDRPPHDP